MKRPAGVAAAVIGAFVLAGCASAAKTTFAAQTTSYDDGALTITTAPPQKTAITQAAAEFDLAHSDLAGYGWAQRRVELGYVTVKPAAMQAFNKGDGVPKAPNDQLSWVLFFAGGKSNCGTVGPTAPTPTFTVAHPSRKLALIVDAATGSGLGYAGAGSGGCVSLSTPRVTQAGGNVSVPWKDAGGKFVIATYPPCVQGTRGTGSGEGDASGTWTFTVVGFRYFGPCHGKPTTAKVSVSFPRPWKHGAVGPVPTGAG